MHIHPSRGSQSQSGAARSSQEQPGEALGRRQQFYDDGSMMTHILDSPMQPGAARASQGQP